MQLSFFPRKKAFKLASVASIYSHKSDILEKKLNALKSFNSKTECKENQNLTFWGPLALWGPFTCNGLEAQVHFLEILKFKYFWNITGVTCAYYSGIIVEISFSHVYDINWNLIFHE